MESCFECDLGLTIFIYFVLLFCKTTLLHTFLRFMFRLNISFFLSMYELMGLDYIPFELDI